MTESIRAVGEALNELDEKWLKRYEILGRAADSANKASASILVLLYGRLEKDELDDATRTLFVDFLLDYCAVCILTTQKNDALRDALMKITGQSAELCNQAVQETIKHYTGETIVRHRKKSKIVLQ